MGQSFVTCSEYLNFKERKKPWACLEKLHSGTPKIPRKLCCDRLFQKTNKNVSFKCIKQCYLPAILCMYLDLMK